MLTVHMIGNAHLDPVWLWQKADAVDAALATARSACDRLEEFPEFVNTASTVWFHDTVRRLDSALFERVQRYVASGRWQCVGPMLVQPDCNLPSAESVAAHYRIGRAWFREHLGVDVTVGYNVDSFGHGAYLPRLLRDAGIDCYCFMRPSPTEHDLPATAFRWRSPDGAEITAFRIARAYTTRVVDIADHVQATLDATSEGREHTMCFFGFGDHGGGPTIEQIQWIIDHAEAFDGARLVFSHPRAYFDALAASDAELPVVEGEIQHHAIGCYAVERRIKVAMVRAEHRIRQADVAIAAFPAHASADAAAQLDTIRLPVLLNQFHDILGGTSLDDASRIAVGELTAAESAARDLLTETTRRSTRKQACPGEHQLLVFNASDEPFEGLVEHEPWIDYKPVERIELRSADGSEVPLQQVAPEAMVGFCRRILFPLSLPPRGTETLQVILHGPADAQRQAESATGEPLGNATSGDGAKVRTDVQPTFTDGGITIGGWSVALAAVDDPGDTWGHEVGNTFPGEPAEPVAWHLPGELVEHGPLRWATCVEGIVGRSSLWCRAMSFAGRSEVRLRLRVNWHEARRRLVLRVAGPGELDRRVDLVTGDAIGRAIDGREYPLAGALAVGNASARAAVIAPEVFSASATSEAAHLTLLRSPYVAYHGGVQPGRPDHPVTDQGVHEFDVVIRPGFAGDGDELAAVMHSLAAPPVTWEVTG